MELSGILELERDTLNKLFAQQGYPCFEIYPWFLTGPAGEGS